MHMHSIYKVVVLVQLNYMYNKNNAPPAEVECPPPPTPAPTSQPTPLYKPFKAVAISDPNLANHSGSPPPRDYQAMLKDVRNMVVISDKRSGGTYMFFVVCAIMRMRRTKDYGFNSVECDAEGEVIANSKADVRVIKCPGREDCASDLEVRRRTACGDVGLCFFGLLCF